jgi:hypothetical protein
MHEADAEVATADLPQQIAVIDDSPSMPGQKSGDAYLLTQ